MGITTNDTFSVQVLRDMGYEISLKGGVRHGLRFQCIGPEDLSTSNLLAAAIAKGMLVDVENNPIRLALVDHQQAFLMRARSEVRPEEAVRLVAACHGYNMSPSGEHDEYVFQWRILIARATLRCEETAIQRFIDAMLNVQKGGSFVF
jgi:hypothetical protein